MSVAVETAAPESVVPDQTGLPDEITLVLGGEQTLHLPSSAGAGYVWEAAVDDEAVVEPRRGSKTSERKASRDRNLARTNC